MLKDVFHLKDKVKLSGTLFQAFKPKTTSVFRRGTSGVTGQSELTLQLT